MDTTRNRFIGFDKKEPVPRFKTEELRNEYLEDQKAKKNKMKNIYLQVESGDSPSLDKWKQSYK